MRGIVYDHNEESGGSGDASHGDCSDVCAPARSDEFDVELSSPRVNSGHNGMWNDGEIRELAPVARSEKM